MGEWHNKTEENLTAIPEFNKKMGARLRELRILRGFSREQFSERLGYAVSHYGLIERGDRSIQTYDLEKISKMFDVSMDWLFGLDSSHVERDVIKEIGALLYDLPDSVLRLIKDLIQAVLKNR